MRDMQEWWETRTGNSLTPGRKYEIQFVIENQQCRHGIESPNTSNVGWSITDDFFICPPGLSCKFGLPEVNDISMYPNPSQGTINIQGIQSEFDQGYVFNVFDIHGRVLHKELLNGSSVNLANLSAGMYIATITYNGQQLMNKRLIISH